MKFSQTFVNYLDDRLKRWLVRFVNDWAGYDQILTAIHYHPNGMDWLEYTFDSSDGRPMTPSSLADALKPLAKEKLENASSLIK